MSERRCETCRWWGRATISYGVCRKCMPASFSVKGACLLLTDTYAYCDQWSEKEKRDDD